MIPDPLDPFTLLGGSVDHLVSDAWSRIMLSLWNSGVWLLKLILQLENYFLVPDISPDGPIKPVYQMTLWLGATLMLVMLMVQLGTAAVRRDGKSISRVLIGTGQFVIVWFGWIGYGVAVLLACAALNKAFLLALFEVEDLRTWEPWAPFTGQDINNAVIATVLGLLGTLLWLAAIAHLLVMLTRAGALIVLAVTTPISAAGLVSDVGKAWFWKSFRWFHAAAFSPVLMTLMMGMGIQLATGAVVGLSDTIQSSIATALPAVVMILASAFSPLALFKLLAFTDPGTSSGAAVRAGMAAVGGMGGLLQGKHGEGGNGNASQADDNGRSGGEEQAESANSSRMMGAVGTAVSALGPVGMAAGTALKAFAMIGGAAASIPNDITNQMGVGHNTYQPDWMPGRNKPDKRQDQGNADDQGNGPSGSSTDDSSQQGNLAPQDSQSADGWGSPAASGHARSDAPDTGPGPAPGPIQPPTANTPASAGSAGGGGSPATPSAGGSAAGSTGGSAASSAVAAAL